jgi:HTH-type transcriptional regulator/antitoxin HigA
MTEILYPFIPDWISPPGGTIADLIEERGWSQADLAKRLGYTLKRMNLLIEGKASITTETALKLENVLGSTADFWLRREALYRTELAQHRAEVDCQQSVSWGELRVKEPLENSKTGFSSPQHRFDHLIVREKKRTHFVRKPAKYGT